MKKTLKFAQFKDAYRYNSISLILTNFALKLGIKNELLDVGCGCGIIGILLKNECKNLNLNLLEIQAENIKLIEKNLKENNINARLFCCDFKDFESDKKFDIIICNPPFYRQGVLQSENNHKNISKTAQFLPLSTLISKANSLLKPRGILYFCYEALAIDKICFLLEDKKFKLTKLQCVHSKPKQAAKFVLIQARKGVKSPCEILEPFYIFKNKNLSKKMKEICLKFKILSYDF
ncbi:MULTISPECIES: tRNA1(Val) (adenine(37)-N6)-methyltransferase [unclassified Campylobacter]|uniref:tRNA1(Val) (adenine(37)-N6)-methyltransferase n=1 Tax=unclassified Campylobacter TaxID=2593542 RepID=UPI001237E66F|nr:MULTISPECIES: methyltransferase [unclassified Campylobacter]KAA6226432.1 methyltransferase [Campylobacter sp. LR286c]KAA6226530.1 methyltransferase [Campylobacter sp. LR185c]KAA6226920.1 methyltransferase [Campylobacter sp. LR196d]KAA6233664.1 methyltransferase [Campylobacter sp. LR291e]KAA6233884.1 methyltransferase [Campylobacter sp. LR264d]